MISPRSLKTSIPQVIFVSLFPGESFQIQVLSCDIPPPCVPAAQTQPQTQFHADPEPPVIMGLKDKLQQSHDQQVDMLRGLGVDACKVYKQKRVERVVSHIIPGTHVCKFCNKSLKNTH